MFRGAQLVEERLQIRLKQSIERDKKKMQLIKDKYEFLFAKKILVMLKQEWNFTISLKFPSKSFFLGISCLLLSKIFLNPSSIIFINFFTRDVEYRFL